jgi:hypothetical protein
LTMLGESCKQLEKEKNRANLERNILGLAAIYFAFRK